MNGMDNTTQQLHYSGDYPADDATTQGQPPVPPPGMPGSPVAPEPLTQFMGAPTTMAAPPESVSGRVSVPAEPGYATAPEAHGYATPPEPPGYQPAPGHAPEPVPPAHAAAPTELERGRTTIADEVVERVIQKVVDLTVEAVEGVHGLRPGVDRYFGQETPAEEETAPATDRAVSVTLTDGRATINLSVEVIFGYAVHDVIDEIRASVISQTERLLGLTVAAVNVAVSEVSFDQPNPVTVPGQRTDDEATGLGRRGRARS